MGLVNKNKKEVSMNKLFKIIMVAGLVVGFGPQLFADWSMGTIGEAQMNDIRAMFANQVYDATTTWSSQDVVDSTEGEFCSADASADVTSIGLYLYANGTPEHMYRYLYYLDTNAKLSNFPHAYNFRIYVNKLTGTPNYIEDLAPSATAMNNLLVSTNFQAKSADTYQTGLYCSIINQLYARDKNKAQGFQQAQNEEQEANDAQNTNDDLMTLATS